MTSRKPLTPAQRAARARALAAEIAGTTRAERRALARKKAAADRRAARGKGVSSD